MPTTESTPQQDRLLQHADELAEWLKASLGDGESFVREQAPLVAQEIVNWHFYSSAVLLAFGVAVLAALTKPMIWAAKDLSNPIEPQNCELSMSVSMFGFVGVVFSLAAVASGAHDMVYAAVAPRLVILDYVATAFN